MKDVGLSRNGQAHVIATMMILLLSVPVFLLCSYLAYVCLKQAKFKHSVVLAMVAIFMLVLSLGILGAVYLLGTQISIEQAALQAR